MAVLARGMVRLQMPVRFKPENESRCMAVKTIFQGLVLFSALFFGGCNERIEPVPEVVVEHEITPRPLKVGASTVTLRLTDAAGNPIDGARINLEGTMSHPGMRPVFSEARVAGPGRYQSSIDFTMAGDWVVIVHITLPNGRKLERQLDVKGIQPG